MSPALLTVLPTDLARSRGGGERFAISLHSALELALPDWQATGVAATTDPEAAPIPDGWIDATSRRSSGVHAQDALSLSALGRALSSDLRLIVAGQWHTRSTAFLRLHHRRARLVAIDFGGGSRVGSLAARLPLPRADLAADYSTFQVDISPVRARARCLIRGGLDPARFTPPPREHRDIDFLLVGRFVPHKGQEQFMAALPTGARACLAGPSGTYESRYQREILARAGERGVSVELDSDDAELVGLYQRSRYVVQVPISHTEPVPELLGLTLLEGMACGCVPIAPATGPSTEFIRDGDNGLTYEAGSIAQLGHAMNRAISGDEARPRLAAAAAAEARLWTWDAAARALLTAMSELL